MNSALLTVLRQEIDRFNHLLAVVILSLQSLQHATKGKIVLTQGLEELYHSLLRSRVPELWQVRLNPHKRHVQHLSYIDLCVRACTRTHAHTHTHIVLW